MAITLNGTTGIVSPKVDALGLELDSKNVVEGGSNANGDYVRFADGTQICTFVGADVNANTANGAIFTSSGSTTWTFPATFSVAPRVTGSVGSTLRWCGLGAPGTTSVIVRHYAAVSDTASQASRLVAIGRWY